MHGKIQIKTIEVEGIRTHERAYDLEDEAQAFCNKLQTGISSLTQLTQNTDNYSPSNWVKDHENEISSFKNFTISASVLINITGFAAGEPGEEKRIIIAEGSATITFTNNDTDSSANNRMYCHGNVNILGNPRDIFIFMYDESVNKWRVR